MAPMCIYVEICGSNGSLSQPKRFPTPGLEKLIILFCDYVATPYVSKP